jgi:hypothetical protein
VDTPKGTLRDMSRPRRNSIRIATKKERTLNLVFGKRFSRKVLRALRFSINELVSGGRLV